VEPGHARLAVTGIFALNGLIFSSWYARLPQIQDDLGLGPGELGLALVGAPIGLLIAQPLIGAVTARRGSHATVAAAPFYVSTVILPALANGTVTLFLAALATGAANGALDISMNAQGISVERAIGKRIFNSLHAAFSFGALGGAGVAAVAAAAGLSPLAHLALVAVAGMAVAAVLVRHLVRDRGDPVAPLFARPSRRLAALGVIGFCALLAEGSVFDWSSIFLADEAHASLGVAPLGLAAFSLSMGVGRLVGDRLATAFGTIALARNGGLLAAAGLGFGLVLAVPTAAVLGFAVMGLGLSILFPLALRAASVAEDPPGADLAAVSSVGYLGFLTGPPLIGLLAGATDLRLALAVPCALLVVAALLSPHLEPRVAPAAR
jgi:MFS family permease